MIVFNGKMRVFFLKNYEEFHASKWYKIGKKSENDQKRVVFGVKKGHFGALFETLFLGSGGLSGGVSDQRLNIRKWVKKG